MYDELLDRWAVPRPRELSRASRGIGNETWFVRSEAGEHVLRLYVNKHSEAIRFEHEILRKLIAADLTFRVPKPLETEAGDTLAIDVDSARPAALFPRIEGEHLDDEDAAGVIKAAAAFASLDMALGALDRTDIAAPAFSGDLRAVHTAITELAQLEEIAGSTGREFAESAAENAMAIYRSLPMQRIHRTLSLDPAEIAALPALVLLQSAIILVWLAGRGLEGRSSPQAIAQCLEQALSIGNWVSANSPRLVAEALRASS